MYTEGPGIYYEPFKSSDVRWNFEKFLINKQGKPIMRYHTSVLPMDIRPDIEELLSYQGPSLNPLFEDF
jgi:glutathione peroxidase